ncbi:MAG TPA: ShlB/FhaC/HecB family hemolysin secretion/activation protein [Nevskiaceae bacterium]|nr:ShlB/FhaC/HecB family hemolysin secretion/activation protein [Nevskiaceae bacterium]
MDRQLAGNPRAWAAAGIALLIHCAVVSAAPAPAPVRHIDIWEFDIDGNSVLDEATITDAVSRYTGPERTADDVDAARASLEAAYKQRGYRTVSVSIPKQSVREGIVRLQVNESHIEHLNVIGSKYHSIDQIKELAPSLAEGEVPDFTRVQHDLAALNQQADRRVTPALKAGNAPGTVDVDLVVDDKLPLHGSLELNNRQSQSTTPLRATAALSYDNLWQRGHSLSLSYNVAPRRSSDSGVWFGSYLMHFSDTSFNLLFNALKSDSNVSTVGGTEVLGTGRMFGLRGVWQLSASEGFYSSATFGADYKHFNTVTMLGSSQLPTPVTYVPFTIGYSAMWRGAAVTQFDGSLMYTAAWIGSDEATLDLNRLSARGNMLSLRLSLATTRPLVADSQLYAAVHTQLTDQPLISNEQFSAGGMDSVRGYYEAETLGDYGFHATTELRSPSMIDALPFGPYPAGEFRGFAFVDGSVLRLRPPVNAGQGDQTSLASFGAGFNFTLSPAFVSSLVWADPLIDGSATRAWSSRFLFRVATSF